MSEWICYDTDTWYYQLYELGWNDQWLKFARTGIPMILCPYGRAPEWMLMLIFSGGRQQGCLEEHSRSGPKVGTETNQGTMKYGWSLLKLEDQWFLWSSTWVIVNSGSRAVYGSTAELAQSGHTDQTRYLKRLIKWIWNITERILIKEKAAIPFWSLWIW